jgi:hypothetical protein
MASLPGMAWLRRWRLSWTLPDLLWFDSNVSLRA